MIFQCPFCATPARPGDPQCPKCRKQMTRRCPTCSEMVSIQSAECKYCGDRAEPEIEFLEERPACAPRKRCGGRVALLLMTLAMAAATAFLIWSYLPK